MPYTSNEDLPAGVKDNLPKHAQEIFREAFNSAWKQYKDPEKRRVGHSREETAYQVAWAAVKNTYEKDEDSGRWRKKGN